MSVQKIKAIAGMRLNSTPEDIQSMPMTGAGTLSDGFAVCDAGNGEQCAKVDGVLRLIGIVSFSNIGKSGVGDDGKEAFKQYDVVPVMRVGRIWVKPTAPITTTGGAVYVRTANPDSTHPLGSLQPSETDGTALLGATWDSLTSEDGLAIVRLRGA